MEVRHSVISSMREDKEQMDALMQRALDIAAQAMPGQEEEGQELLVSGERRLLISRQTLQLSRAVRCYF